MNIYEKLSAITSEIANVEKSIEIGFNGKAKYKAFGETDILNAVKPLEAKYKVYSYPVKRTIIQTGERGNQLFERIETIYRFINIEKPDEFIDITSYGDGLDVGDKSVGKAMTYADKYALMKAYKITTGEDPDQEASNEPLDKDLLAKAQELKIELVALASYLKKNPNALTNEDLINAINKKEAYIKAHGNKEVKQ